MTDPMLAAHETLAVFGFACIYIVAQDAFIRAVAGDDIQDDGEP